MNDKLELFLIHLPTGIRWSVLNSWYSHYSLIPAEIQPWTVYFSFFSTQIATRVSCILCLPTIICSFFGIYGHNKFITLFFLQLVSSSVGKKRFTLRCTISMGHNSLKVSVTRTSQQFRTRFVSKVQNRPNSFQFSILLFLL